MDGELFPCGCRLRNADGLPVYIKRDQPYAVEVIVPVLTKA